MKVGGDVVSTVMLVENSEGEFGVWNMATAEGHRRKGYGKTLLACAMNEKIATGECAFHLYATEDGEPLYRRMGFKASGWVNLYYPKQ